MDKKTQLQQEIEAKQKELALLEAREIDVLRKKAIKELSEYTPQEKIEAFDKFYEMASDFFDNYNEESDDEHWAWEAVVSVLGRDNKIFWAYYRKCHS